MREFKPRCGLFEIASVLVCFDDVNLRGNPLYYDFEAQITPDLSPICEKSRKETTKSSTLSS